MQFDVEVRLQNLGMDAGCTSNVVYINDQSIFCANAGDSRSCLYSNNQVIPLSEDHKPDNTDELARIKKANHYVLDQRVDGNLALSRAFGDFHYKDQSNLPAEDQAVSAHPEVTIQARKAEDKFIVMACDGIWDCLSNEACCDKVNQLHSELDKKDTLNNYNISNVVEEMFETILAPNTDDGIGTDNMTCILIYFKK
jgi:serine/threonine protein phosphatase PrpC